MFTYRTISIRSRYPFLVACAILLVAAIWVHIFGEANPSTLDPSKDAFFRAQNVSAAFSVSPTEWSEFRIRFRPNSEDKLGVAAWYHLLHFHGISAEYPGYGIESSRHAVKLLTDAVEGRAYFGEAPLIRTRWGVRFPTAGFGRLRTPNLEAHRDQGLAILGELGIPMEHRIRLASGDAVFLRDILADSIANFHLEQDELEWTALAYLLFLPPELEWVNHYDQRFSFDGLARELLARSPVRGSCGGLHRLYSLASMLRSHRVYPIFSPDTYRLIREHIDQAVSIALRDQRGDGTWSVDWLVALGGGWARGATEGVEVNKMLVTGHTAEWLLIVQELDSSSSSAAALHRTGRWLWDRLRAASHKQLFDDLCPYSHAAVVVAKLVEEH